MVFNLKIRPKAYNDLDAAPHYYSLGSQRAAEKLFREFTKALDDIASNPYYQVRYKKFRSYKLLSFPYSVYYSINEKHSMITCYALVNLHQDFNKYPK